MLSTWKKIIFLSENLTATVFTSNTQSYRSLKKNKKKSVKTKKVYFFPWWVVYRTLA